MPIDDRWAGATLALLLALGAGEARAIPAPVITTLAPPRPAQGEHRVARESWRVDCGRLVATGRCQSTLTMQLAGGVALDLIVDDAPPTVTLGGAPVVLGAPQLDDAGQRYLRLVVPEGLATLAITTSIAPRHETRRDFLIFPADETRHLALHDGRVEGSYAIEVLGTPAAWRLAGYTLGLEVVVDPELTWSPVGSRDVLLAWQGDARLRRIELAPAADAPPGLVASGRDVGVFVSLTDPGDVVHFGGPMLGLGAGSADDRTWFLARLEYEIAIADFVLPGISLDVSSRGLVLAPRVEVSTPHIALIPSFWAGVGLPIRLETDPDLGARLMVGFQFGPVGGLVSFDLRPGDGGLRSELGALLRLSL